MDEALQLVRIRENMSAKMDGNNNTFIEKKMLIFCSIIPDVKTLTLIDKYGEV